MDRRDFAALVGAGIVFPGTLAKALIQPAVTESANGDYFAPPSSYALSQPPVKLTGLEGLADDDCPQYLLNSFTIDKGEGNEGYQIAFPYNPYYGIQFVHYGTAWLNHVDYHKSVALNPTGEAFNHYPIIFSCYTLSELIIGSPALDIECYMTWYRMPSDRINTTWLKSKNEGIWVPPFETKDIWADIRDCVRAALKSCHYCSVFEFEDMPGWFGVCCHDNPDLRCAKGYNMARTPASFKGLNYGGLNYE